MKCVLGIGVAGCNIAEQLAEYPVYNCYYISNEIKKTTKYRFALPECSGPEQYESLSMDKLHRWIGKIEKNCTVILCGASDTAAITLRALEFLHKKGVKIDVIYFAPEVEVLSETKALLERSVRGILQNFARSC